MAYCSEQSAGLRGHLRILSEGGVGCYFSASLGVIIEAKTVNGLLKIGRSAILTSMCITRMFNGRRENGL